MKKTKNPNDDEQPNKRTLRYWAGTRRGSVICTSSICLAKNLLAHLTYLFWASLISVVPILSAKTQSGTPRAELDPTRLSNLSRFENAKRTEDSVLTVLGRWPWGYCQAVDANSSHAFIGNGPTFHALDISDSSSPRIVGEYVTNAIINDVRLRDTIAYICNEEELLILDVRDPHLPSRVGGLLISGVPTRVAPSDSFAYVANLSGVCSVVDISDLTLPRLRGAVAVGEQPPSISARGRFAYCGRRDLPGLRILDATNPDMPTASTFDVGGLVTSTFIRDTLLLVGVSGSRMKVYSIVQPDTPKFISQVTFPPTILWALTVEGTIAYAVAKDSGVYAIDVSNLTSLQIRGLVRRVLRPSNQPASIAARGTVVLASFYNGLLISDATNPDSLRETAFFPTGGYAETVALRDTVAFVASGFSGLWILNVSDPQRPYALSNISTGGYTCDIAISDSFAYIVNCDLGGPLPDSTRGLWVISVVNLLQPYALSHHVGITEYPQGFYHKNSLVRKGSLLFVTQPGGVQVDSVLEIIDVSNPFQPRTAGIFRTSYSPYYVALGDSVAYLATPDGGIRVIDIRSAESPMEVGSVLASALGVSSRDEFAYALRESLWVINMINPSNPVIVGSTFTRPSNTTFRSTISGNYLYWAQGELGAIDISNPSDPIQRTMFLGNSYATGVTAFDNKVFLCEGWEGVLVLENNLVTSVKDPKNQEHVQRIRLFQNYPNPFNPSTKITFRVGSPGNVKLEVFNILGQRILTLLNQGVNSGTHTIVFDGSPLPAGVYFYRLNSAKAFESRKMILLK